LLIFPNGEEKEKNGEKENARRRGGGAEEACDGAVFPPRVLRFGGVSFFFNGINSQISREGKIDLVIRSKKIYIKFKFIAYFLIKYNIF
jgi:hypothetical protein